MFEAGIFMLSLSLVLFSDLASLYERLSVLNADHYMRGYLCWTLIIIWEVICAER